MFTPLSGIQALPIPPEKPDIFLLGASSDSAQLAANLGIGFVFAGFLNSDDTVLNEASPAYRSKFAAGRFIVSLAVVAAPIPTGSRRAGK